jgi:hypothetical protein
MWLKGLWKVFLTMTIFIQTSVSTIGAVDHVFQDDIEEDRIIILIQKLSTYNTVYLSYIMNFVLWSKEDEEVHVGKCALLKFNYIYVGNVFTKAAMDFDIFQ